ncbi:hypothetical protein U1Q18_000549, partial [Sarracenia purpurea var. burkii]
MEHSHGGGIMDRKPFEEHHCATPLHPLSRSGYSHIGASEGVPKMLTPNSFCVLRKQ